MNVKIELKFRDIATANAIAQACKRATNYTAADLAANEKEASRILDGFQDLRESLKTAGFAPR
jgi:hypothetical protein